MMTWCRDGVYFYRSRREGGRVISEYLGAGAVGAAAARREEERRAEDLAERDRDRAAREEARQLEETLHDLARVSDELVAETLTTAGYHRHHRGEWRRRRQSS
jgi:hypothetical protein